MKIGVYDLIDSKKYYYLDSVDTSDCHILDFISIRPLLVVPEGDSENRSSYLIDENNIILDDIAKAEIEKLGKVSQIVFRLNFKNTYSIEKLLIGLIAQINDIGFARRSYSVDLYGVPDKTKYSKLLFDWFKYQNSLLDNSKGIIGNGNKCEYTIIPVIESCGAIAQDCIIQANASSGTKTVLLWRSVAACLGIEDNLFSYSLRDGDNVYVLDSNSMCLTLSKITMHDRDGRLIPGHHLYKESGSAIRMVKSYPYEVLPKYEQMDNIDRYFPYSNDLNGIVKRTDYEPEPIHKKVHIPSDAKYVICVGDVSQIILDFDIGFQADIPVYKDLKGTCIINGAGKFAYRMSHGIVSYYDESEALSIAKINKDEEVELHPLIEASEFREGGLEVKGDTVTGLSIDLSNDAVEFYLLLGNQSRSRQLKVLRQDLKLDLNKPKKIPIKLESTLVAGQGQAKVLIEPVNEIDREYINSVFLDWEKMTDAFDGDEKISIEYLEEHMERTFPVNIPAPSMNYDKFDSNKSKIKAYLDSDGSYPFDDLNLSGWPNRGISKGIEQFERDNIFGSPEGFLDMPKNDYDRELSIKFFKKLNSAYKIAYKKYIESEHKFKYYPYVTPIAWTYHSEYFPDVLQRLRKKLKDVICGEEKTLRSQEISLCTNLLFDSCKRSNNKKPTKKMVQENDLILFMNAFFVRCKDSKRLSNWLRGAYQIIMYNTSFLEYVDIDKIYENIDNVLIYFSQQRKGTTINQVYSYFIFLLKVRRFHPSFCKPLSSYPNDHIYYTKLTYLTEPIKYSVFTSIVRMKQCLEYPLVLSSGDEEMAALSCDINAHNFASLYSHFSWKAFLNMLDSISVAWFPSAIKDAELYRFSIGDYKLYSLNLFKRLGIDKEQLDEITYIRWSSVLKSYLNGKGNLPILVESGVLDAGADQ